ncbi:hypothetical protein [Phascolarctobacterium faecium]
MTTTEKRYQHQRQLCQRRNVNLTAKGDVNITSSDNTNVSK